MHQYKGQTVKTAFIILFLKQFFFFYIKKNKLKAQVFKLLVLRTPSTFTASLRSWTTKSQVPVLDPNFDPSFYLSRTKIKNIFLQDSFRNLEEEIFDLAGFGAKVERLTSDHRTKGSIPPPPFMEMYVL